MILFCKLVALSLGQNCVTGLKLTNILKQIKFEGVRVQFKAKNSFQRQLSTKYLIQTLVLREIMHHGKGSISIFQEIFTSINRIVISGEELSTRQQFYKVVRFSWYVLIS